MITASYFIEVVKIDGVTKQLSPYHISYLEKSFQINNKFGTETIAIFKIYPKVNKEQTKLF